MNNDNYYIAIDLGAESGRVIIGILDSHKLKLEEIHRFPTKQIIENGTIYWDINYIYSQIKNGIKKASLLGYKNPKGIGIDSWAVDFGLLDKNDELIELPIAYRDKRTDGMMEKVFDTISRNELYSIAGIQFLKFNTIFQLYSLVQNRSEVLKTAKSLLLIPDLLNYFLTGEKFSEYTNATTTSMLEACTKQVSNEILDKLNLPSEIVQNIIPPISKIGTVKSEIAIELGIELTDVIAIGSHDTASAIAAVPAEGNNWAYLSSGTWSLLGIEVAEPILSDKALEYSFTNEGGIENTIRFLKNIMGLWILQRSRLSWLKDHKNLDYPTIIQLAEKEDSFQAFFDPDNERFFNPEDMIIELEKYLSESEQIIPVGVGAMGRMILENLSFKVAYYLQQVSCFKDESIETLHVVGGGSKNKLLNQFISNACNIKVIAGPDEGTAAGNIMAQALYRGDIRSLSEIRQFIRNSYNIEEYNPQNNAVWERNYNRFLEKCNLK